MLSKKEEEYLKRQKALGYEPSLMGMDEEDLDYVPSWAQGRTPSLPLTQEYRPVDREFAERILRLFERKWDPNWQMPDLDGSEFSKQPQPWVGGSGNQEYTPAIGTGQDYEGQTMNGAGIKPAVFESNGIVDGKLVSRAPGANDFAYSTYGGTIKASGPSLSETWKRIGEVGKEAIKLNKFGEKAYEAAMKEGYGHDEAMEIAKDAQWMHTTYRVADLGSNVLWRWPLVAPILAGKEVAKEIYGDDIENNIIQQAINYRKKPAPLPSDATVLLP